MRARNLLLVRPHRYTAIGRKVPVLLMLVLLVFNIASPRIFADSTCDTDTPMLAPSDGSLTECQRQLYSSGVYDFDLTTVSPGCSSGGVGATQDANLTGSDNEAKAFTYFTQKGLPPITAAAIVGNLVAESGLNPTRTGGYIAQWGGSRLDNLNKYANQRNQPVTSLALQLDFVSIELRLLPVPNGLSVGDYSHVLTATKAQTDIGEATGYFMGTYTFDWYKQHSFNGQNLYSLLDPAAISFINAHGAVAGYEGPGVPHLDHRISNAKGALQLYGGQAAATTTTTSDPTQATQTTTPDTTTTDTTSTCGTDGSTGSPGGSSGPAVAGQGFIGNCAGQGSFAAIHCGQCVAYAEWVLAHHFTPYMKNPKDLTTGLNGWAAETITANLGKIYGVAVDKTPAVHSVFTIPASVLGNGYGHVGIVSQVTTDGSGKVTSIVIEQSNWSPPGNNEMYDKETWDAAKIAHYQMTFAHTEANWQ